MNTFWNTMLLHKLKNHDLKCILYTKTSYCTFTSFALSCSSLILSAKRKTLRIGVSNFCQYCKRNQFFFNFRYCYRCIKKPVIQLAEKPSSTLQLAVTFLEKLTSDDQINFRLFEEFVFLSSS